MQRKFLEKTAMKRQFLCYVLLAIGNSHGFLSCMNSGSPLPTHSDFYCLLKELQFSKRQIESASKESAHKHPLGWAAWSLLNSSTRKTLVNRLLEMGVDPNYCPSDIPGSPLRRIFLNCHDRSHDALENLLNGGASLYQCAQRQENILRTYAENYSSRSVMEQLLDFGADVRSQDGIDAFNATASSWRFNEALVLAYCGAKYDIAEFMQKSGSFVKNHFSVLVWLLLNNCPLPTAQDSQRKLRKLLSLTSGMWGCIRGDLKTDKKLVNRLRKPEAPTGLHWAAARGHEHIVELLLKKKHNPNSGYFNGVTPADLALRNNHQACLERILDAGGKLQTEGLLHRAIITKNSDKINLLLKYHPHMVNERDGFGHTPLHTVLSTYAPDWNLINKLLDQDIEAQFIANKSNVTPLRLLYTIAPKEYFYRRACTALSYSMKFLSKSSDDFVRQLPQDMPELVYCMAELLVGQCTRDGYGQLYKPFFRTLGAVRLVTSSRCAIPEEQALAAQRTLNDIKM
jgi:ankyrin repeat protein